MAKLVLIRHGQSQWNMENKFTGWVDVPLTDKGKAEAVAGAKFIGDIKFNMAYTSVLQRAQTTLELMLNEIDQKDIPVEKDQALNERHYGALQGLDKAETAEKYGDEQVHIWRRSYDIPPPTDVTEMNPEGFSESLKDTAARTLPYFNDNILPKVKEGQNILVAAHGNSLRSIVMDLDKLSKEEVLQLNIDTGAPIIYDIEASGEITNKDVTKHD